MKNIFIVLIPLIFLLGCGYGDRNDINYKSCSPKPVFKGLHESISPKKFWVGVHSDIESSLKYDIESPSSLCSHVRNRDSNIECQSTSKNIQSSLRRCLEHSRVMCRLEGGYC